MRGLPWAAPSCAVEDDEVSASAVRCVTRCDDVPPSSASSSRPCAAADDGDELGDAAASASNCAAMSDMAGALGERCFPHRPR